MITRWPRAPRGVQGDLYRECKKIGMTREEISSVPELGAFALYEQMAEAIETSIRERDERRAKIREAL